MKVPALALSKECKNLHHIYLFYVEGKWCSFGYSAYYLSLIYPELEGSEVPSEDYARFLPCVYVPDSYLPALSDSYNALVSDAYIEVSAPPTAYCYRKDYDRWRKENNFQLI